MIAAGVRYRYYVSQPGLHGEARTATLGSVSRVPAPEIEQAITSAVQRHVAEQKLQPWNSDDPIKFDRAVLAALVSRIEIQRTKLVMSLKPTDRSTESMTFLIPWQKPPARRFREILLPNGALREHIRPDRAERRLRLISAIARGRRWLDEIVSGSITDAALLQSASDARCARPISRSRSHSLLPNSSRQRLTAASRAASISSACGIPTRTGPSNSRISASIRIESGADRSCNFLNITVRPLRAFGLLVT